MNYRIKVTIAAAIIAVFLIFIIAARYPAPIASIIVPDNYATIQEAVDHALPGQTVYVKSGIYTAQYITINKPLSLIGANPDNTVLVGTNDIKYSPPYVIQVCADNVKISGFTIQHGALGGIRIEKIGSEHQPTQVTITNNNIVDNKGNGISNYGGDHFTIMDNNFSNNTQHGVYLGASHSLVSGNRVTYNGWFGMLIDSCNDVTITNNVISQNGVQINDQVKKGGICLRWYGDFRISTNNITSNFGDGVQLGEGARNIAVCNNNILGNTVGVDLFNFPISNNSEGIGIGNQVYKNNIVNTKNAVVQTAFSYGNISNVAYVIGNGTDIVTWDDGSVGNYWGDYNGTESYLIDQNNSDYHPLPMPVNISERPLNVPTLPTNHEQPLNQVILNIAYSGQWFGIYGGPNSPTVAWGGNTCRSVVLSRPSDASPWVIATVTQGFHLRIPNMTATITDLNGHVLAYQSKDSYDGTIITLDVNVDKPSQNLTYDFTTGIVAET